MACAAYECGMDTTTLSFPNYRVSGMAVRRKHKAKRPEPLWAEHKMLKSTEIAAERTEIACAGREMCSVRSGYFQVRACPQLVRRCVASTPVESP